MKNQNWRLVLLLIAGFAGSQLASRLGVGALFYGAAVTAGGLYLIRRPVDGIWIGFFLLAMTAYLYPIEFDELGTPVQGVFRPFIGVLAVVGAAMFIGRWARPRRRHLGPVHGYAGIGRAMFALVAVLLLTLVYGYFGQGNAPSFADVIRNCSGWMTFFFFLLLGYRLSPSVAEHQRAFGRLRLVAFVQSPFFVMAYINVWLSDGPESAKFFAYSQRDAVFFSGVVLALLTVEKLAPRFKSADRRIWLVAGVLLIAVLFSGSRGTLVSVLLAAVSLAVFWHARTPLSGALVVGAALVLILLGFSLISTSLSESREGLLGSLATRFIFNPVEDTSFLARASQLDAVADAIRHNPLLGRGMLASYSYFDPMFGWKDTTFVDTGLGYVLMKTGLLGMGIFMWFAGASLRMIGRLRACFPQGALAPLASFVFYLAFLLFAPSFFEFQYSWFIGIVMGCAISMSSGLLRPGLAQLPNALRHSAAQAF